MHSLHRILVNLTPFGPATKEELISEARDYAEKETECYANTAFSWRETDTAGAWSDDYPVNVMLGATEPKQIVKEI